MTTASIQNPSSRVLTGRPAFWRDVADALLVVLSDDELHAIDWLSDAEVLARYFPHLDDAQRHELLWAVGGATGDI